MLYIEALAHARSIGSYERVVSLIRKSLKRFTTEEMVDYFDVSEQDCSAVIDCIHEHPDWDNEKVARYIAWSN